MIDERPDARELAQSTIAAIVTLPPTA